MSTSLLIPDDLSVEDFRRLTEIAVTANEAAGTQDPQLQRIETTLELALIEIENEESPCAS